MARAMVGLHSEDKPLDFFDLSRGLKGAHVDLREANGKSVRGRIIDLSLNAARALGMMQSGVVRVSIQ